MVAFQVCETHTVGSEKSETTGENASDCIYLVKENGTFKSEIIIIFNVHIFSIEMIV